MISPFYKPPGNLTSPVRPNRKSLTHSRSANLFPRQLERMADSPAQQAQIETKSSEKISKQITAEQFITEWPLYLVADVDGFSPPLRVSFYCHGTCDKETTWAKMYDPTPLSEKSPDKTILSVGYTCLLCHNSHLTVVFQEVESESRRAKTTSMSIRLPSPPAMVSVVTKVIKMGQIPQLALEIPKGLAKGLGKDAQALYRKGLINRNYGYGLGAAVYIRRVVEDKTNELIEVAAQLAESYDIDAKKVLKMRAAASSAKYTSYEEKLKVASTVFPDSLKVGSVNPLKTLYGLVSKGIHSLSEAECIEIADQTADVFDFIFTNLRAQIAERKAFEDKVKKLSQPPKKGTQAAVPE
jgi:hypothetical protein